MVPTIRRRAVLPQALGALLEDPHAGALAVVRHGLDDREARAAVGARDEGVAVATIRRVEKLLLALRAERHVGRHRETAPGFCLGRGHLKVGVPLGIHYPRLHRIEARQGRGLGAEAGHEIGQVLWATLDLDAHGPGLVPNPARQVEARGQTVHEGTKADPLHDARHPNVACLPSIRRLEKAGQGRGFGGARPSRARNKKDHLGLTPPALRRTLAKSPATTPGPRPSAPR